MRRTKVVCTIGPASDDMDVLRRMVAAGLNVARLNFSHGSHAEHNERIARIRRVADESGLHIPIMLDTKGPELRIGRFASGSVRLEQGQRFVLTTRPVAGSASEVHVNSPGFPGFVHPGSRLQLDDGRIELTVVAVSGPDVECTVVVGGILGDRKRIAIPGGKSPCPPCQTRTRRTCCSAQQGSTWRPPSYAAPPHARHQVFWRTTGPASP